VTAMVGVPALWQMLERPHFVAGSRARCAGGNGVRVGNGAQSHARQGARRRRGARSLWPRHQALGGNIKWLISGGAALPKETHDLFSGLGLRLTEGYGLTEAAPVLTVAKSSPNSPSGQVGKAIPGVEIKIDNPDDHGVGEVIRARPQRDGRANTDHDARRACSTTKGGFTPVISEARQARRLEIVGASKTSSSRRRAKMCIPRTWSGASGPWPT